MKPGVEGPIAVTTGLNLESISGMDHLNESRIKWPGVEMPSQAAGAASRHGVLRLRSASPHFAQHDRVGKFATCY